MLPFFKQTHTRSFVHLSALREKFLYLVTCSRQAWIQHLLALVVSALLSLSLAFTWAVQIHSPSTARVDTSMMLIVAREPASRQIQKSVFQLDVTSLPHQTWEEGEERA